MRFRSMKLLWHCSRYYLVPKASHMIWTPKRYCQKLANMVHLSVTPKTSLADSSLWICASGLAPSQPVTLFASLTDEKGVKFEARAFYRANSAGEVDVKQAPALGGHYQGVWPMGLFCSLKPEKMFFRLLKRDVVGSPFDIQVSIFNSFVLLDSPTEAPLATCTVERWFVAPGVERFQIRKGRVRGALYVPPGPGPFPGVIDLFGGVGGLIEFRAGLLASKGFAVLALAYFGYDDLPQSITELDLEYFAEASTMLLEHPKVRGPGLGVIGVSKGGEIALAMATFLEQIVATVCINGPTRLHGTPLRFHDVYMPAAPYCPEKFLVTEMGILSNTYGAQDPEDESCVIPLEKAQGHILFVVGEADASLNSKLHAELAIARARKYGKNNCILLSYPGAGHLIESPGSPLCFSSFMRNCYRPVQWGGKLELHAKAQEHSWKEIQKFFELHLGQSGSSNL
uniref:Bile acid-CoA:amino acid N-acyltransferase isoform X1 n=2 Tax=Pogona vitticeps TaxID=103695 RepID=A0A6J0TIJ9_9SAUR